MIFVRVTMRKIVQLAVALACLALPVAVRAQEGRVSDRGTVFEQRIGDLKVTYLTGKDADAATPVFDMSVGDIILENTGGRPISLSYDSHRAGFGGHQFDFGGEGQNPYADPRPEVYDPPSPIDFVLKPGALIQISRRDLMELYERLVGDGTLCTRYAASILVDGRAQRLEFGPHCFRVVRARDWAGEEKRYLEFFAARDRG